MPHSADTTRRPRRDRLENRERLLAAYVQLVAAGQRDVRVEDVAAAAGVARATAYRHIPDERALRLAVYGRAVEQVARAIDSVRTKNLDDQLEAVAAAGLAAMRDHALDAMPKPTDEVRLERAIDGLFARLERPLAAGQTAGALTDDLSTDLLAELFVSLIESVSRERPGDARLVVRLFLGAAGPS